MKNKIIDYGIILFAVYVIINIYSMWEENDHQRIQLEDCKEIILKQRELIDAQEQYINFLIKQDSSSFPIHPKRNNFGPI
jgi:hypothetical protein|tara:strand:- start:5043 stop:5282 length:240 start_codon:yes stop_codon:yes gene_type:complete